ncbi:Gfo/Idh/MocA family oxidoreductase [Bacillus sp. FJAT-49732]|uniref:Gfo/Idh/MocA family oxidoreductase n=1 Tax=Lederbergia citrisecunda TaxID=2833583 RepID=A0A942TKD0_9BACI|nr:Gfo/Idh/MocA family oxidoreductase [Lederbergia citrisecunda]MBS4199225.1 Gfo/Idh/MocA family oxidoreductase [Lederbergia citrisecunda]
MVVRFGLIGCGYISKKHLWALSSCKGTQLTAVSDLSVERMEEAKKYYQTVSSGQEYPIKFYKNYQKMLEDDDIDAVIIASFTGLHAQMANAALEASKHVILEKPMALSIKEANELILLSQKQNKELMVCHQLRFMPIMQRIKKMIDDGKLGKLFLGVCSIRINRSPEYYSLASWRGKWESDGGMLINQGIHVIDLLQWFFGDAVTVYGETMQYLSQLKETEDAAVGVISFCNQAKGIIEANIVTQPNNLGYSLSIFGEKGTICIEGQSLNQISRWYIEGEEVNKEELNQLINDKNEEIYLYENFLEAVDSDNKHVLIDGKEGKKALELIFALYQSSLKHEVVNCPLETFATSDMNRKDGN